MPLELQNFIVPKNSTEGLYKIAEQMQQQKAAQAKAAKDAATQKAVGSKYLSSQFQNKHLYTGTPFDPMADKTVSEALKAGYDILNSGGDINDVNMATRQYADQWNQYATSAKDYQLQEKELLKQINQKTGGAVDPTLFSQKLRERIFKKDDKTGQLDVGGYSPDTFLSVADDVLKNENVYNEDKAIQNWTKSVPALDYGVREKTKNADGSYTDKVYNVQHPFFVQPIVDETTGKLKPNQFEVKYDIVKDASGNTLLDETGQQHRVVPQDIMTKLEGTPLMGAIDAQTKEILNQHGKGVTIDSPEGQLVKSAIAYHMLDKANSYTKGKSREVIDEGERTDLAKKGMIEFAAKTRAKYRLPEETVTQGNAYDEIGATTPVPIFYNENKKTLFGTTPIPVQGQMINGVAYDKEGKPLEGVNIMIGKNNLPTNLIDPLNKNKINVEDNVMFTTGVGGKAEEMQTRSQGKLSRQGLENLQKEEQIKAKTAPKKVFGTRQSAPQVPKKVVKKITVGELD